MWKYRSAVIFGLALAFALKTAFKGDVVSLLSTLTFLTCHYLDRYLGAERVEAKIQAKLQAYEEEIKSIKTDISRIGLTMGIRGGK